MAGSLKRNLQIMRWITHMHTHWPTLQRDPARNPKMTITMESPPGYVLGLTVCINVHYLRQMHEALQSFKAALEKFTCENKKVG